MIGPLEQAQRLVARLQQSTDLPEAEALRAELETLTQLLQQAAHQMSQSQQQSADFTSTMVHELRKPMTSIRGFADMLAKPGLVGTLNEQQQQFAETIRNNVVRMDALLGDLSDLNKLRVGRLNLEKRVTAFSEIVPGVEKVIAPLAAEYEHVLNYDVPQTLPLLMTDAKQLAKVLTHLLRNAVLYTPKGGHIAMRAERLGDSTMVRVSVADNGIGIRSADIPRLGEPFFRADHELVTAQKGYGVGLAVVKGLLALMESQLEVLSAPDQGSTFSFVLAGISGE